MKNWIRNIVKWFSSSKVRKFIHTSGFGDGTLYIEYFKGAVACVNREGVRTDGGPSLERSEKWSKEGVYKEIT